MALSLRQKVEINSPLLDILEFYDVTGAYSSVNTGGYGSPNPTYGDINKTRLLIAVYPAQETAAVMSAGSSFEVNKAYMKTDGLPSTIDGKQFYVSNIFTPLVSGLTVPSGDKWIWTGYVVINSNYVPNNSNNPLYISIPNLLQQGDTIADGIYTIEYQIFRSQSALPISAVNESTYIVGGTGTVSYNGNIYRGGEVFTADNGNTISVASGSPSVSKLEAANTKDYILSPNLENTYSQTVVAATQRSANFDDEVQSEIFKGRIILDAFKFNFFTNAINFTYAHTMLNELTQNIVRLKNSLTFRL